MEEFFKKYRELDVKIIKALDVNEEKADELFNEKEKHLKNIKKIHLKQEELKKLYYEKGLDVLDKEIEEKIKINMNNIKNEMRKNNKLSKARDSYNNSIKRREIFSTTI